MKKLINVSNHPSTGWTEKQKAGWDEIIDIPFPQVSPELDGREVSHLAWETYKQIIRRLYAEYRKGLRGKPSPRPEADRLIRQKLLSDVVLHVAGEFCLFFNLVSLVKADRGRVVVATSKREVVEEVQPDGSTKKTIRFNFIKWREV